MRLDPGSVIERLSAMPSSSPIKRMLRAPLHFIPPGLRVPVVRGRFKASGGLWGQASIAAGWEHMIGRNRGS